MGNSGGIAVEPKLPQFHLALATIYETQNKTDLAIKEYEETIKLAEKTKQSSPVPYNNLAYLYIKENKNLDKALEYALKAVIISPKQGAILDTLGLVYYHKANYNEALNVLKKALEQLPNDPNIRYHLGMAYSKSGKPAEAKKELQAALDLSGKFPEAEEARILLNSIK